MSQHRRGCVITTLTTKTTTTTTCYCCCCQGSVTAPETKGSYSGGRGWKLRKVENERTALSGEGELFRKLGSEWNAGAGKLCHNRTRAGRLVDLTLRYKCGAEWLLLFFSNRTQKSNRKRDARVPDIRTAGVQRCIRRDVTPFPVTLGRGSAECFWRISVSIAAWCRDEVHVFGGTGTVTVIGRYHLMIKMSRSSSQRTSVLGVHYFALKRDDS